MSIVVEEIPASMRDINPRSVGEMDIKIGAALRAERKARNISLEDVGAAMGISWQQVYKYEAGQNRISLSRFLEIADALSMNPLSFMERLCEPHESSSVEVLTLLGVSGAHSLLASFSLLPTSRRNLALAIVRALAGEEEEAA